MYNYYRSDTRIPAKIFSTGFISIQYQVSPELARTQSFAEALRGKINDNSLSLHPDNEYYSSYSAQDVDSGYTVCISRKFESSALFPITTEEDTYIYIMFLPQAQPIHLEYGEIYGNVAIPECGVNEVFDVHSLQTQQAHCIAQLCHREKIAYDPKGLAWPLFGYECMSTRITPDRIMGAVKIERQKLPLAKRCGSLSLDRKFLPEKIIQFRVKEFYTNPNFVTTDVIAYSQLYHKFSSCAAETLQGRGWMTTPDFAYGLGGTLLPVPSEQAEWISITNPAISEMDDSVGSVF